MLAAFYGGARRGIVIIIAIIFIDIIIAHELLSARKLL